MKKWSPSSRIGLQAIIEQLTTMATVAMLAIFGKPDLYFGDSLRDYYNGRASGQHELLK